MNYFALHTANGITVSAAFTIEEDRDEFIRRNPEARREADRPDDISGYRPAMWSNFPQRDLCGWQKLVEEVEAGSTEDLENDFPDDPPLAEILPPMPVQRELGL